MGSESVSHEGRQIEPKIFKAGPLSPFSSEIVGGIPYLVSLMREGNKRLESLPPHPTLEQVESVDNEFYKPVLEMAFRYSNQNEDQVYSLAVQTWVSRMDLYSPFPEKMHDILFAEVDALTDLKVGRNLRADIIARVFNIRFSKNTELWLEETQDIIEKDAGKIILLAFDADLKDGRKLAALPELPKPKRKRVVSKMMEHSTKFVKSFFSKEDDPNSPSEMVIIDNGEYPFIIPQKIGVPKECKIIRIGARELELTDVCEGAGVPVNEDKAAGKEIALDLNNIVRICATDQITVLTRDGRVYSSVGLASLQPLFVKLAGRGLRAEPQTQTAATPQLP